MARDLETLKDVLWTAFEKAAARQRDYDDHDPNYSRESYPESFSIKGRTSLGTLAQAIVAVESEQRVRAESASAAPSLLKKPAGGG